MTLLQREAASNMAEHAATPNQSRSIDAAAISPDRAMKAMTTLAVPSKILAMLILLLLSGGQGEGAPVGDLSPFVRPPLCRKLGSIRGPLLGIV